MKQTVIKVGITQNKRRASNKADRQMRNPSNNQKGVTIMELMVVASIFAVVMTMISTMFIHITRKNNMVVFKQRIGGETQFALNAMAVEIRSGVIDYAAYGGNAVGIQDRLSLIDHEGARVNFSLDAGTLMISRSDADPGVNHPVTSPDVEVRDLRFSISPAFDPEEVIGVLDHPKVTIVWHAENRSQNQAEIQAMDVQTTISSRRYK